MEAKEVSNDSNEAKELNYVDVFQFQFDLVRNITKEQAKGILEFISIISQRIECELQHSRELTRIGSLQCRLNYGYLVILS